MGQVFSKPFRMGGASHEEVTVYGHWGITEEAVRLRAYFISLESGGVNPTKDWQCAEEEFLAEAGIRTARRIRRIRGMTLSQRT